MSIYISNVALPKPGYSKSYKVYDDGDVYELYEDKLVGSAVAVKSHGRLVDADKFEVFSYTETEGYPDTFDAGVMFMLNQLDNAETVIAADEDE